MNKFFVAEEHQHLPQLSPTPDSQASLSDALDLLSLCNLVILSNALDPRTYSYASRNDIERTKLNQAYDCNDITFQERLSICHCHGICLDMLRWFRADYVCKKDNEEVDLISIYLVQQCRNISRYKFRVQRAKIPSTDGCTEANLSKQIRAALALDDKSLALWNKSGRHWKDDALREENDRSWWNDSLYLEEPERYTVICARSRGQWEAKDVSYEKAGMTELDCKYMSGQTERCNLERESLATLVLPQSKMCRKK